MVDITEYKLQILELEDLIKTTRNPVVKSDAESKIAILKKTIKNINNSKDKSAILQKDVPVRIDHVDKEVNNRRQITNTGETFSELL